jgi:hypothetical protein
MSATAAQYMAQALASRVQSFREGFFEMTGAVFSSTSGRNALTVWLTVPTTPRSSAQRLPSTRRSCSRYKRRHHALRSFADTCRDESKQRDVRDSGAMLASPRSGDNVISGQCAESLQRVACSFIPRDRLMDVHNPGCR